MDNEEIPSVPSTPATPEWTLEDGALPKVSCSLPPPPVPLAKKVGAEFIGTYILMFAGIATAIVNQKTHNSETLIGCAGATGLAVMIIILSTGHISGAHLNPAVTISFAALKHFPWKNVPLYIGAQILASICAAFSLKGVFHPFMNVATDTRAVGELAGIAVGATVMLNILIAGPATGGSMNPVRTLGPAIAANNYKGIWLYIIAPILGALAGAGAYTAVKLPDEDFNSEVKASSAPGSFRR
ncbi:unnamed protein product [Lathyrus oleraceus]